jgi:hypothetical protein
MTCDEIRELLEAYALGALDVDEEESVESHLPECPDCRLLANEYIDAANMLPYALSLVSPFSLPSSVKGHLLQSLEAASPPTPSPSATEKPSGAWRPIPAWRWPSLWRPRALATLAALILLALLVAWSVRLNVALSRERALRAEFASLVSQQEVVLEVVDSSKTLRVLLRPPAGGSRAYGKLYTRPDMPHVVVMAARLSQPTPGQAYHLWLTSGSETRLAGVMAVNKGGFGLLVFDADQDGPVYEAARLTLQPEGTSAPSGDPVLLWEAPR